jgi:hypothetical protein
MAGLILGLIAPNSVAIGFTFVFLGLAGIYWTAATNKYVHSDDIEMLFSKLNFIEQSAFSPELFKKMSESPAVKRYLLTLKEKGQREELRVIDAIKMSLWFDLHQRLMENEQRKIVLNEILDNSLPPGNHNSSR